MSDQVIPFPSHDTLDRTGQEVLSRLQRAAAIAEQNTQHAVALAHQELIEGVQGRIGHHLIIEDGRLEIGSDGRLIREWCG